MREGLRSQTRLGKVSAGGEVVEKGGVKNEAFDLSGEGSVPRGEAPNLTIEKKDVVECAVKEECDLDLDVSTCGSVENVDFAENGINMSCYSGGSSVKEAKEEGSNDKVLIGGRVLRSRLKGGDDKKSCNGDNDGVLSGKSREHGGLEGIKVKKEYEEAKDEVVTNCHENERVKLKNEGCKRNLKRKRGRPPKIELKEQDQLVDQLPRKRGRPPKTELKEQDQLVDQLKRKRGRPPKAGLQNRLLTVVHNRKGKVGLRKGKKGLTMRDGVNVNAIEDTRTRRSSGKELEKRGFSPVKKNKFGKVLKTENNGVASPLRSNTVNASVAEKSGKSKVKQLVREQIMERLSAAGWTVDYRPRNGKEYNDAVYVSLDGKTHWSITLAYKRLKNHYEAGDGEGKVYGPGFKFTPIPEEDFKILTKVMKKKRKSKDKWKQKGEKGGKTIDGVNRKVKKEKPGSGAGIGKSMMGKMKRKRSLLEEGNADVTSPNRMPILVRDHKRHKTQNKKRCALLVRNAEDEIDSETDGYVPYNGKRTVLAWMIDLGTILQNEKVHYMQNGRICALLDGKITGDGIHCGCCNEIVTISDFEAHAGSKLSDPLKNIYREGGTSLLQCLLDSWNKQDESEGKGFHFVDIAGEDPNDDTCGVCGDGGDLICCDGCPSTFHQSCLDIKKFPSGDWHCIYCCCKFCGLAGRSSNLRDGYDDFTVSTLLTCHLCEEKYHRSCIEANGAKTDASRDPFFCGNKCQEYYLPDEGSGPSLSDSRRPLILFSVFGPHLKLSEKLEMLLGVKHEIEDGFSWTFIQRSDVGFDASQIKPQMVEYNSKLAVALSVMDECFMPYIDHRSGINLIHSILYNCGSNFKRLNYSGFFTAILERGDEIISAASIRIHGNQLAEMPFIGTRYMYRRQGMCRRLLNAIECALSSLNVELLVIPAISELRETWTSVFGFEPLDLTSKQIINNMNLLVFPHVDMLQKKISKHKFADENLIPTEVSNLQKNHTLPKVANNCDGSSGSDLINSAGILPSNACQINDKTMSVESGYWLPEGSLNDTPDITINTIHHDKSPNDVACEVVCQAVHKNLAVEDKNTANVRDYVSDTCYRAEGISKYKNTSCDCIILNHDEKPIDLDTQLNKCCVTYEERQCLGVSRISTEATEEGGHYFDTRESKDSADSIHHDSQKISDSCELRSKTDWVQPYFIGSKEVQAESVNGCGSSSRPNVDCATDEAVLTTDVLMPLKSQNITKDLPVNCDKSSSVVSAPNADEAEVCLAKAPNLKTNINPGDCQSILVSSGFGEEILNGVNEKSKASCVAEANFLPADTDIAPNNKPRMTGSSELAEPDLQVDQTARSNAPSSCSPNAASGVGLHWTSAGSTSCGSTEVIVLSNQAS